MAGKAGKTAGKTATARRAKKTVTARKGSSAAKTEPPVDDWLARNLGKFWAWVNKTDLMHVIIGGALGGFLMPLVRKFLQSEAPFRESIKTPEYYDAWFLGSLLGAISAGVVVYSLSYSENNNRRQVFFISLLAGLTFPGFLSGALDVEKQAENVQTGVAEVKQAAVSATGEGATEVEKELLAKQGAEGLTDAFQGLKAEALDEQDRAVVVDEAKVAIDAIAETAIQPDGDVNTKIAEQVEQAVTAAKIQGYEIKEKSSVTDAVLVKLNAQREREAEEKKSLIAEKLEKEELAEKKQERKVLPPG